MDTIQTVLKPWINCLKNAAESKMKLRLQGASWLPLLIRFAASNETSQAHLKSAVPEVWTCV